MVGPWKIEPERSSKHGSTSYNSGSMSIQPYTEAAWTRISEHIPKLELSAGLDAHLLILDIGRPHILTEHLLECVVQWSAAFLIPPPEFQCVRIYTIAMDIFGFDCGYLQADKVVSKLGNSGGVSTFSCVHPKIRFWRLILNEAYNVQCLTPFGLKEGRRHAGKCSLILIPELW